MNGKYEISYNTVHQSYLKYNEGLKKITVPDDTLLLGLPYTTYGECISPNQGTGYVGYDMVSNCPNSINRNFYDGIQRPIKTKELSKIYFRCDNSSFMTPDRRVCYFKSFPHEKVIIIDHGYLFKNNKWRLKRIYANYKGLYYIEDRNYNTIERDNCHIAVMCNENDSKCQKCNYSKNYYVEFKPLSILSQFVYCDKPENYQQIDEIIKIHQKISTNGQNRYVL